MSLTATIPLGTRDVSHLLPSNIAVSVPAGTVVTFSLEVAEDGVNFKPFSFATVDVDRMIPNQPCGLGVGFQNPNGNQNPLYSVRTIAKIGNFEVAVPLTQVIDKTITVPTPPA